MTVHHDAAGPDGELAAAIAEALKTAGEVRTRYRDHSERDRLRHGGRRAGHLLNRPVRTFDLPTSDPTTDGTGTVAVVLTDWAETNPLEGTLSEIRGNKAVDRVLGT